MRLSPSGLLEEFDSESGFLGYLGRDVQGIPVSSLHDPDQNAEGQGLDVGLEPALARGAGGMLHYLNVTPLDEGGLHFRLLDVTQATCQLQAQALQSACRPFMDALRDATLIINRANRVVHANARAEAMLAARAADLIGVSACTLLPDFPELLGHLESGSALLSVRRPDGGERTVDAHVSPLQAELSAFRLVCLAADGVADCEGERLPQAETRFRALIEGVEEYAIFTLDPQGRVQTWNAGAQRITGYARKEILGRHFSCFYSPEDIAAGKPQAVLAAAKRDGRFAEDAERARRDGSRFWANVVVTAIRDERGRLQGFTKITRDITERRRAEKLERERNAAEEREKVRQRFLQIAAHELRNPMAGIKGMVDLVQGRIQRGQALSDASGLVGMMGKEVDRLAVLLSEVIEAFRTDDPSFRIDPVPVDLAQVLECALAPGREAHPERTIEVRLEPAQRVIVRGDPLRLEAVVRNVLDNAIKYSASAAPVAVSLSREAKSAHLTISDQGIGIPEDDLEHVFEGFFRASNLAEHDPGGLGLGLYLCCQIIRRHSGRMWIESRVGAGTSVHIAIPRWEATDDTSVRGG